jgi:hypothetical protein
MYAIRDICRGSRRIRMVVSCRSSDTISYGRRKCAIQDLWMSKGIPRPVWLEGEARKPYRSGNARRTSINPVWHTSGGHNECIMRLLGGKVECCLDLILLSAIVDRLHIERSCERSGSLVLVFLHKLCPYMVIGRE